MRIFAKRNFRHRIEIEGGKNEIRRRARQRERQRQRENLREGEEGRTLTWRRGGSRGGETHARSKVRRGAGTKRREDGCGCGAMRCERIGLREGRGDEEGREEVRGEQGRRARGAPRGGADVQQQHGGCCVQGDEEVGRRSWRG